MFICINITKLYLQLGFERYRYWVIRYWAIIASIGPIGFRAILFLDHMASTNNVMAQTQWRPGDKHLVCQTAAERRTV